MRIAQLAPLEERVPPENYGGTELIVSLLTERLVANGHEVTLFASGDSITQARLVTVTKNALRSDSSIPVRRWPAYNLRLLMELERRQNEFDIVHNHMGYQAFPFLQRLKCRSVTTNHNPIKEYCADLYLSFKGLPYVAISKSYRELNYPAALNYVDTIYNGIDIDCYKLSTETNRPYLLFLGRLGYDKGTLAAIQIAHRLGYPLKLAGKVDEADRPYFHENIEPLLGKKGIEYLGEVNFEQKLSLYSKAKAVIYPIAFAEPFGLVMVEAMAVGTPVIALNKGSVKEIISDKETGIIGNTVEELIARFTEVDKISPQACRDRAVKLFSHRRMVTEYEKLYQQLCA